MGTSTAPLVADMSIGIQQPPAFPILDRQHLTLVATETAPLLARALVDMALQRWDTHRSVRPDVHLVVTELVTNVLRHAARATGGLSIFDIVLDLLADSAVRVLVYDTSPRMPVLRTATADNESSRGLLVVSALSRGWGAFPLAAGGKAVWADIALATELPADPSNVRLMGRVLGAVREL